VHFTTVIRYAVMILSSALMVLGVLVMAGLLVPRYFPSEYRVILGAVVFLYGTYRFVIGYFQKPKE